MNASHGRKELEAVRLDREAGELVVLDQTLLPGEIKEVRLRAPRDVREAIHSLRVRGAPAIGIAAGYGAYLASLDIEAEDHADFLRQFRAAADCLASSRPTAVNLSWALGRMVRRAEAAEGLPLPALRAALLEEADAIRAEDAAMCRAIGEHGLSLLRPGMGILTHCNAGWLAASRYGTALAPVYLGQERGCRFRVFADETRPLLQGARLTAFELAAAGVDVTLLCDNMASAVMKKGWIDAVLVGCDRVAMNGDVANKIGTSGVAVLAKHYGIPLYVLGPTSTIDRECASGDSIVIEERRAEEVTELWYARRMAPEGVSVCNPAFDVTENSLVTAIITEKGIARAPFGEAFRGWGMGSD